MLHINTHTNKHSLGKFVDHVHGFQKEEFSISCTFSSKIKTGPQSKSDQRTGLNQNKRPYQNNFPFLRMLLFLLLSEN